MSAARERTGASGGDVVIVDPRDGAVLALAGVRDGKPAYTSTPIVEAYEPGSVLKPFVLAKLLERGACVQLFAGSRAQGPRSA